MQRGLREPVGAQAISFPPRSPRLQLSSLVGKSASASALPAARAVFAGLGRHHGPGNLTRAVLEGVAFNLYTGLRAFIENGTNITAVDAIGGAANSSLLLQISANVWGVPVTRLNLVDEATALGAAVVGGVGVGIFDSFGIAQSLSRQIATHGPDERRHARYMAEYELFLEAYQRMEPWFDKL